MKIFINLLAATCVFLGLIYFTGVVVEFVTRGTYMREVASMSMIYFFFGAISFGVAKIIELLELFVAEMRFFRHNIKKEE